MPTNKHRATAPDGTVLKRNSKTRTYTHCIAGLEVEEDRRRRASHRVEDLSRQLAYCQRKLGGQEPFWQGETHDTVSRDAQRTYETLKKAQQELDAIDGDRWGDLSWVSRPDLIPARISEFEKRGSWARVIAIPAEIS